MRAAVLAGRRSIEMVADLPAPVAGAGDVLVRMEAVGICGSDLSGYDAPWQPGNAGRRVLGHEGVGRVVQAPATSHLVAGQRVAVEPNFVCGRCEPCRRGLTSNCARKVIVGATYPGLLSEFVAIPGQFLWPIPEHVPLLDAVCVEPLAVVRSALRKAAVAADEEWLIIGAGSLGLLACLALSATGAAPVVVDTNVKRVERACQLGASSLDGQAAFRYALDTTGVTAALAAHLDRLAPGARLVLVGISDQPVPLDYRTLVRRELSVAGSLIYEHPSDFPATVSLIAAGDLRPSRVVDTVYPLAESARAFADAREQGGKSVIVFDS